MSKQYGLLIDRHRCVGCRTCMIACKMEHRLPEEVFRMKVYNHEGTIENDRPMAKGANYEMNWTPTPCMHCREPKCIPECPTGAIKKREDGIVFIDQELCNGCEACIAACPYGVPEFMKKYNVADKCDLCMHRIDTGRKPICVEVCPGRAISVGEIDGAYSPLAERVKNEGAYQMLPEEGTNPSVYYKAPK